MSPNRLKRYSKIKVRHQRKELDQRKKRISGLTLVQDMGQSSREPDGKQTTKATTGFTRAVRDFGEQRRLFDTEAYASVVSKVKPRPNITKGRLTVPTQGLFARGKISKPACRGRQTKAPDCELHEIIRQAQNNPRGQEYQLQKQRQRDCSPEVDDPDPLPSPDQSSQSLEGRSPAHDDRFSPDYTSTKRQKEHRSFPHDALPLGAEAASCTVVRDASPPSNADRTTSPSIKDMFSASAKETLSPGSRDDDASVREMELEEKVMDGMTKWIMQMRAALNFSELGYLQEARKYLKDLHKETLRQELEMAAVTQMAVAAKPTLHTPNDVLQSTLERNARKIPQGIEISLSNFTSHMRTNQMELEMPGPANQTPRQEEQHSEFRDHHLQLAARQTRHQASSTNNSYKPREGNPFANRDKNNAAHFQTQETICNAKDDTEELSESTDESFNFSPNVSAITEYPNAFDMGEAPKDQGRQKGNSFRLRDGRERVDYAQAQAAEERERLRRIKEVEYQGKFQAYKEKLRSGDRCRGRSCNRPSHLVDASPGRSSKSLDRSFKSVWDQRLRSNNPGPSREGMRKFGEGNRVWYTKDEIRRQEGNHRPWDGESSSYRRPGMKFEERHYQDYDLRSPLGLPDWLLEKTPERVFRAQKMFN